jgi:N-acetylglucosamine kinase-like BadF-type ATPase
MVRRLGEVLQTIGGYGFHIYDDGGARWITIRYETENAARKARDLIAKALVGAISVKVHG